ncbi:MAG: L-2-hydroxyglutarate oxidase [uncultured Rubrobacteraceae bacterium]|uniref:L-2-hydroxyglutarate oxidase n=1 Tax=uncultured Rubrobacteraceae bacterium TaxID=349277 RepID=A0A6J4Q8L2_9ACTN|nr:MAG: L-2-hydroxyglutarate oxidase [uncultured Rubrobacteraceae bacterium]
MYDFAVIGGGIVGLSTARALLERYPGAGVVVLEKEAGWARHQTGHNSGVIHSGVYYKPGSLKARFSKEGSERLVEFCQEQGITHEVCGKVIVATNPQEVARLSNLYERGTKNGLKVEHIGPNQLKELEPHAAGIAALKVPSTGIVDFVGVAKAFARTVSKKGGELRTGAEVTGIYEENADGVEVRVSGGEGLRARALVNCAGLHSDRVAALGGVEAGVKIVPFRGEYYDLKPEKRHLVKSLIYPVPDPAFPFLGVHFTRTTQGGVETGPNAVVGLAREGYKKTDVRLKDLGEVVSYPAFWRLAARHWKTGAGEVLRSISKKAFVRGLQKLVPEVEEEDLVSTEAGVRAQALRRDGKLVDDFFVVEGRRSVHVLNAPSPAATACIPIGEAIADQVSRYAFDGQPRSGR